MNSYPAAVVLHQVQLDGLHAAIVTACVDLKQEIMCKDLDIKLCLMYLQLKFIRALSSENM